MMGGASSGAPFLFGEIMKRLLDFDPETGIKETFEYTGPGKFVIHTEQDVASILEANQRRATDGTGGWTPSKDMRYVGSIPASIILKWKLEKGVDVYNRDHWPAVKRLLNDNEWQKLRGAHWNV